MNYITYGVTVNNIHENVLSPTLPMQKTCTCLCSDPELSFVFRKNWSWQEQALPVLATHGVEWILWILKDFFVHELGKIACKRDGSEFSLNGQIQQCGTN